MTALDPSTVAERLRVGLDRHEQAVPRPMVDIEAHNAFLEGRYHLARGTSPALAQALACFERSIALDPGFALAFDSLRRFRDRVRDGKPAYTVFDDKTLAAIADRLPGDLGELSGVKGVGPAKLEQYGDDVLAVIATVVSAP